MNLWDRDLFATAWNFATQAHHGQTYGGAADGEKIDYANHVASVAMELIWALQFDPSADGDLAIPCALLHDTIEDTGTRYETLVELFGIRIADGVMALSKNPAIPSKAEQLADSLRRIKEQPKEIWMVKLADRITNLYGPPYYWDNAKMLSYQSEAQLILDTLSTANAQLAERLRSKIEAYCQYFRPSVSCRNQPRP